VIVGVLAAASGLGVESLVVVYNVRDLHGGAWVPGALLASVAASSFAVTVLLPNSGRRSRLLRSAGLTSLIGALVAGGGFLSGAHAGAVVAIVASGAFFAVLSPANVIVGPLLPTAVRASAFSVLMGVLVIAQTLGATGAGVLADHLSTAHAAALMCLPALVGGLAVLLMRRAPDGYDDDIEAPIPPAEIGRPRAADLAPALAAAPGVYAAVQAERVALEPEYVALEPEYVALEPERVASARPEYAPALPVSYAPALPVFYGPALPVHDTARRGKRVRVQPEYFAPIEPEYEPEYSPHG
jgi:MFS family permease